MQLPPDPTPPDWMQHNTPAHFSFGLPTSRMGLLVIVMVSPGATETEFPLKQPLPSRQKYDVYPAPTTNGLVSFGGVYQTASAGELSERVIVHFQTFWELWVQGCTVEPTNQL